MKKDSLGDRMKANYEDRYRFFLTRRTPVIMRLDGKAFHTFTKGCKKPYDQDIIDTMASTAAYLIKNIQGAKLAYVQSDEISILITDYDALETDAWYDYNIQKMVSVSAAMASTSFTITYNISKGMFPCELYKLAHFDSRVFNIPKEEVINYFRWRYQDWQRNSMAMLAQSLYSQKELHGKKFEEQGKMCYDKGHDWFALDKQLSNGTLFVKNNGGFSQLVNFNLNDNNQAEIIFDEFL